MLNFTLVATAILLVGANAGVYSRVLRSITCILCILGLLLALMAGVVWLGLLSLLLVGAMSAHEFCARRWWRFPAVSGFAAAVAFGITVLLAQPEQRHLETLRVQFPFETLEERLPAKSSDAPAQQLSSESENRLTAWEHETRGRSWSSRSWALERLHEEQVDVFTRNPKFGVSRMVRSPLGQLPATLRPDDLYVPQPNGASARTHDDITSSVQIHGGKLHDIHTAGLLDFINFENFGYVKDRRNVAGFQSHRFIKVPEPAEGWRVETLDLVGLLLHKEPVAYVSANLPRMDELKTAPTRALDRFETEGLEKLRGGEDLVTAEASANLRMLGSVRSAELCVQCHGGRRGDLLGAFSYTLTGGGQ